MGHNQYLKKRFGSGYRVTVSTDPSVEGGDERAHALVTRLMPEARLTKSFSGNLSYEGVCVCV